MPKLTISLGTLAIAMCAVAALWAPFNRGGPPNSMDIRTPGPITFTKHIAPILFAHCGECHRPGQAAPFSLLSYADAQRHAKQIAEVTQRRIMPPWLPRPGYGEFAGARGLTPAQIELVQQWVSQGVKEGAASDLPSLPRWTEGWHLGKPDLIVEMPQPYLLPPEGKDIYRNFVIPVPIPVSRSVRAAEFRPGNPRAVHHAFIRFDPTQDSRRLDQRDPEPGFDGIHTPGSARSPDGFFLSWQPGKLPAKPVEGLSWLLEKDSDLVLQVHLQPSGKPEPIRSSVGFYFADQPPTNAPFKIELTTFDIDIPAGAKAHVVRDSYRLPVDAEVIGVLPHAHFLATQVHGFATLPDGTRKWLLRIDEWNFNWQGDYRYAKPVSLPKGTTLTMEIVYDNSADNPRNANRPPKRVQYGLQSFDEMAEIWFQVLVRNRADRERLARDYQPKFTREIIAYNQYLLRLNPKDARAQTELAKVLVSERRFAEASSYLQSAAENAPDYDEPHYFLGLLLRNQKKLDEAKKAFENAVRINPENFKAHGNLGLACLEQSDFRAAEIHFRRALAINPNDTVARESLDELLKAKRNAPRSQ
ncbi:MAG: tetratricopeptide repeat protein [Verrucomicrobia bacterium]|nr:tetratricopeptide repeat protein [Verrucomicrobiota bacterium]